MTVLISFEDGSSGYLSHHGVKGMKWGKWNAETRNRYGRLMYPGGKMKNGTVLARYSRESEFKDYKHDPKSGAVKYVSTNAADHAKWRNLFDYDHKVFNDPKVSYETIYETTGSIRVASAKKAGKLYVDKVMPTLSSGARDDQKWYFTDHITPRIEKAGGTVSTSDPYEAVKGSRRAAKDVGKLLASNSLRFVSVDGHDEAGKKLMGELKKRGYDAVQDAIGWDTSADPIIVFDPKKNLKVIEDRKL